MHEGLSRKIPLTLYESGITAVSVAYSALMDGPDWWAAKSVWNYMENRPYTDEERWNGANNIIDALWSEEKTRQLRIRLENREPVFITVPSTSGANALVPALAERLCGQYGLNKDVSVIHGEEVAKFLHSEPMKNVPRNDRPYVPREYLLLSPPALIRRIAGRSVVVVEDVFSSGASAKAFCDVLAEARIQVTIVVGLLGDSRLDCEPQLVSKLQRTLKHAGIAVKSKNIAAVLSRGQVTILIDNINKAQGKDEYTNIAAQLQRILDSRAARHLGKDTWRSS